LKTLEGFEADFSAAGPRKDEVFKIGNELIGLHYSGAGEIKQRIASLESTWSALRSQVMWRVERERDQMQSGVLNSIYR
jgi:hypothetical protein